MSLYNCKSTNTPFLWRMTKFDSDLNPDKTYLVSISDCSCPAGYRPTCRHRQMLPKFTRLKAVDKPWFLDFEANTWEKHSDHSDSGQDIQATLGSDSVA